MSTNMAAEGEARQRIPELEPYIVPDEDITPTSREIGKGAYGSVEEVEIPGAVCAAKKLHDGLIEFGSDYQVHQWVTSFVNECKLASKLRHPNIVQFLGVCYLPGSNLPVLLMEKLLTSLHDLLEKNKDIPFDIKVSILIGVDCGLVFLHSRVPPIAHRDLSARNILLDSALTAKIADLGVARMVNIQPGKLAATMTQGPGNIIYMPPEAVGKEGTKYNTAIDVFSFGNVVLFTLTQVFQDNLLAPTYFNSETNLLEARTEIERRIEYVSLLHKDYDKDHPLVQLVLHCLEYLPEDRPSASEVLERLKEVKSHTIQEWNMTKLDLVHCVQQPKRYPLTKEQEKQLSEKQAKINEKQEQIDRLKEKTSQKQELIGQRQEELTEIRQHINQLEKNSVQKDEEAHQMHNEIALLRVSVTEKQEQVDGLLEQTHLQQQQLEDQRTDIEQQQNPILEVAYLDLQLEEDIKKSTPSKKAGTIPTVVNFDWPWKLCNPQFVAFIEQRKDDLWNYICHIYTRQLVSLHSTVYGKQDCQICEYTPGNDQFKVLSEHHDEYFTLARLKQQLVLVTGYYDYNTRSVSRNTRLFVKVWNSLTLEWDDPFPECPLPGRYYPAVVAYKNYLIVAGGFKLSEFFRPAYLDNVLVLDSDNGKWSLGISLPVVDNYNPVVIDDTLYLVGCEHRNVLRTYLTTPVGQLFDWELLPPVPVSNHSSVVANGNILTFGEDSVHLFSPQTNKWTRVGDFLPGCLACVLLSSGEILAVGDNYIKFAKLNIGTQIRTETQLK